jgi:hypothetical protein
VIASGAELVGADGLALDVHGNAFRADLAWSHGVRAVPRRSALARMAAVVANPCAPSPVPTVPAARPQGSVPPRAPQNVTSAPPVTRSYRKLTKKKPKKRTTRLRMA